MRLLRTIWCAVRTRHRRELAASNGTHSLKFTCERCFRERVVNIDTGQRPIPCLPVKHSLAPKFTDRLGR
jgi:hypothetical protein